MVEGRESSPEPSISHRRQFYRLREGVYLVPGVQRAAIYDTNTENVYSINQSAQQILLGRQQNADFVESIKKQNLIDGREPQRVERKTPKFQLEFVWFEIISDDCNERCLHCYADSMPPTYRKALERRNVQELSMLNDNTQGYKELKARLKLSTERWKQLIQEVRDLGCRDCQFIGGEPFLWRGDNKETVLDLAAHAKGLGYNQIEIFTNGTLINPRDIPRIKKLGLTVAISLYSDQESVHDEITRTPGSFRKTVQTLKRLKDAQIPTRVETVLMKQNETTIESTNQFIAGMGFSHRLPDVLRPKGRGGDSSFSPSDESTVRYGMMLGPNFSASSNFFQRSVDGHSCLAGKIAITDTGQVMPCIFSRDKVVGSVRRRSIKEALEGKIKDIWETTKDDVLVCQDCEYRYACFDCRPISQGATYGKGDYKNAPYPRCTYNPYTGEWDGGTWKLDHKGEPIYDEGLKLIIDRTRGENLLDFQQQGHS